MRLVEVAEDNGDCVAEFLILIPDPDNIVHLTILVGSLLTGHMLQSDTTAVAFSCFSFLSIILYTFKSHT